MCFCNTNNISEERETYRCMRDALVKLFSRRLQISHRRGLQTRDQGGRCRDVTVHLFGQTLSLGQRSRIDGPRRQNTPTHRDGGKHQS